MLGLSGLLAIEAGLWGQGSGCCDEYCRKHLFRSGGWRNGKDLIGAFRKSASKAAEHEHHPQRQNDLHIHADGQPYSSEQDFHAHAGYVRGSSCRQLLRTHRAEDIPLRDCGGQCESGKGNSSLPTDTHSDGLHE